MHKPCLLRALVALVLCSFAINATAQILFDNKTTIGNPGQIGIVTNPGGGAGGFDASAIQTGETSFGFTVAVGFLVAEDFTVPAGVNWTITGAHVFNYQTGATAPTTTAGVVRVLDAPPTGAFNVLSGDTTTNRLQAGSNVFMNLYRTNTTDIGTATNRRLQDNILNLPAPLILGPGTYWINWGLTEGGSTAGFCPPLYPSPAPGANVPTGNALQTTAAGATTYAAAADTGVPKGLPFQLIGTSTPIPEPASMALVSLGLIGLVLRRR